MNKSKNFIELFFGMGINVILSIVTTPIITRLVSPEAYGGLSLFNTYANIAMLIVMIGQDQAYLRFFYREDDIDYKRYILKNTIKTPLILSIITTLFMTITLLVSKDKNILIPIFGIYIVSLVIGNFATLTLRLMLKTKLYSIIINMQKIIYLLLVICIIKFLSINHSLVLIISTVLSQIVITIICIIKEKNIWFKNHEKKNYGISTKTLFIYGFPFIFSNLCNWIFTGADKIMLQQMSSQLAVGIYASAVSIISVFSIITTTFNTIWGPIAIEEYEKNGENTKLFTKATGYIAVIMFIVGATIVLLKDIVILFLGKEYSEAVHLIPFLTLYPIMYTLSESTGYGINFSGKTYYNIVVMATSALINILLNLMLIPKYQALGAAIATGITYTCMFIIRTKISLKFYKVNYDLIKTFIVAFSYYVFVIYITFNTINLISIVMFCIFILINIIIYKNRIVELIGIVKELIINRKKK